MPYRSSWSIDYRFGPYRVRRTRQCPASGGLRPEPGTLICVLLNSDKQQRVRHLSQNCQGSKGQVRWPSARPRSENGRPRRLANGLRTRSGTTRQDALAKSQGPRRKEALEDDRQEARHAERGKRAKQRPGHRRKRAIPKATRASTGRVEPSRRRCRCPRLRWTWSAAGTAVRTGRAEMAESRQEHEGMSSGHHRRRRGCRRRGCVLHRRRSAGR